MASKNPFLELFDDPKMSPPPPSPPLPGSLLLHRINDLVEDAFALTLNQFRILGRSSGGPGSSKPCRDGGLVWLQDFAQGLDPSVVVSWLEDDLLERALFERLLMSQQTLRGQVISEKELRLDPESHLIESRCAVYLSTCFERLCTARLHGNKDDRELKEATDRFKKTVVLNLVTAFREPDLYDGQDLLGQMLEILKDGCANKNPYVREMLHLLVELFPTENEGRKKFVFSLLSAVASELPQTYGNLYEWASLVEFVEYVVTGDEVAQHFMLFNFPSDKADGKAFEETLLGSLLSASCLPKQELGPYEYFEHPSQQPSSVHAKAEEAVWTSTAVLQDRLADLFRTLLRAGPEPLHRTLSWIGHCFEANKGRGKLWAAQMRLLAASPYVSDGFMVNLGGVLLRLSEPFCKGTRNPRLLKIDMEYAGVECQTEQEQRSKHVHLFGLSKEVCIQHDRLPRTDEKAKTFNFITDVFFITHKCLDLGHRVIYEKLVKLNQELNRLQQLFGEVANQSADAVEDIRKEMDSSMTRYMCLKAAVLEPTSLKLLIDFSSSTASLLVHEAVAGEDEKEGREREMEKLRFPLQKRTPRAVFCYVPEFFFENLYENLLLLKRFCPAQLEEDENFLTVTMDWILTFMAAPVWIVNPHLRAKLAECLDCLLPHHRLTTDTGGGYLRERLFLTYPNRLEIVSTLVHVFVDIETTGQSVQFEYKFSYRKPMYDVMKYLWEMEEHKEKFHDIAKHAVEHIEDEEAPLFLRFVNLLVNDAIFLLDEGLNYMKQIQEQEGERDGWQQLPANQRSQNEAQLNHIGRLARYHNIMGMETIGLLALLTSKIHEVFSHATMVDRIAAMLNYFLKSLVGPERKSFKVKNLEQFEFRPAKIVTKICTIYVNLSHCSPFIKAVSQDGRSYSPELFEQAKAILLRIDQSGIVDDLDALSRKVQSSSSTQMEEDALFSNAPDHFLDPIMSVLMRDPVKLPTSGKIVDRPTIARHLLSDQSDPFNRMQLTLDKVIPQKELKEEIEAWIEQQRRKQV